MPAAAAGLLNLPLRPCSPSTPQLNVQAVHRFFQDCCQKYGAGGLYKLRLLHLRIVVLCDPLLVQAVLSRGADLPKAAEVYDTIDAVGGCGGSGITMPVLQSSAPGSRQQRG